MTEVNRVIIGVIYPTLLAASKVVILIFIFTLLLYVNPKLSIIIFIIFSIIYGIVYYIAREYLRNIGELSSKATFEKYKFTDEAFSGIKDIKLRRTELEFLEKYSQPAKKFAKYTAKSIAVSIIPRYAIETLAFGGLLLIVLFFILTSENYMDVIPLVALYALAGYRIMPGLQQIYHSITQIRYNTPALRLLLKDLVGNLPFLKKEGIYFDSPKDKISIQLKSVSFKYPNTDNQILENINLKIPNNTLTALVGKTGSEKLL